MASRTKLNEADGWMPLSQRTQTTLKHGAAKSSPKHAALVMDFSISRKHVQLGGGRWIGLVAGPNGELPDKLHNMRYG